VLALSSDAGTDALPAIIFAAIAWGDYADGIAARVTGQYSKLGALLDPVIDRALVLAGVVVVWHFETLPRWALAVLAAREVVQLLYGQWALRHGIDLTVNWPGRAAVWPVMSAIFFALVGLESLAEVLLYIGIALAVWATALYIREGSSSR
jgi:cardiolipin synthase